MIYMLKKCHLYPLDSLLCKPESVTSYWWTLCCYPENQVRDLGWQKTEPAQEGSEKCQKSPNDENDSTWRPRTALRESDVLKKPRVACCLTMPGFSLLWVLGSNLSNNLFLFPLYYAKTKKCVTLSTPIFIISLITSIRKHELKKNH